jgi:hypothetical protein
MLGTFLLHYEASGKSVRFYLFIPPETVRGWDLVARRSRSLLMPCPPGCMCVCVCVYSVCVYVCVCVREREGDMLSQDAEQELLGNGRVEEGKAGVGERASC